MTGLSAGQEVHWSNRGPEQVAQSSWHDTQAPPVVLPAAEEVELPDTAEVSEKVFVGHWEVHFPSKANWPEPEHVRQNAAEPAQDAQEELQAWQLTPSLPTNWPAGH